MPFGGLGGGDPVRLLVPRDLQPGDDRPLLTADLVDGRHLVQDGIGVVRRQVVGHRAASVASPLHRANEFIELFLRLLDGADG